MLRSFSNSWTLVKSSAHVLKMDKELMLLPILSGIGTLLVTASFVTSLSVTGGWEIFAAEGATYAGWVVVFLFYLVNYFVIFFFNSALVGAALIRMDGGDPTVSDGLSIAFSRIGTILGYAVIAATVGMVLRFLAERAGAVGRMVIGLVGIGFTLATYLTVPVLVTRDVGPVDAVKESAALFKETWGEQVVGNFGIGWAVALMALSWTVVSFGLVFALAQLGGGAALVGVGVAVLGYGFLVVFSAALKGIYTAALYRFAAHGDPGPFDQAVVASAFRPR